MTDTPRKILSEASRRSAGGQALDPGLYLVSTPIGNLRDITLRALDVLGAADRVLAEDTRVTRRLLDAHSIRADLSAYHDHNGDRVRPEILDALDGGAVIALVSDAGTPLVSDPGFKLVREAIARNIRVVPVPGASAVLSALTMAGLPTDSFAFAGFPPPRAAAREAWLAEFRHVPGTLVFYEGASRVDATLASMAKVFGPRPAAVCRELTKMYEEARRGTLADLAEHYAGAGAPRGEIVIVVGPPEDDSWDAGRIDAALEKALQDMRVKDAAREVALASGWSRRDVYARALSLKDVET
ncbi:16S rRNA (cytidine(1402)-2'-O)-methyltransferase [Maricaulis sp. CAU 1757]